MDVEGELRSRAARVRADAARLQRYAAQVAAVERVAWESPAGALFRSRADGQVASLRLLARRVEALAGHLDALAVDVREASEGSR